MVETLCSELIEIVRSLEKNCSVEAFLEKVLLPIKEKKDFAIANAHREIIQQNLGKRMEVYGELSLSHARGFLCQETLVKNNSDTPKLYRDEYFRIFRQVPTLHFSKKYIEPFVQGLQMAQALRVVIDHPPLWSEDEDL